MAKQIRALRKKNEDLRAYVSNVESVAEKGGAKLEETKKVIKKRVPN